MKDVQTVSIGSGANMCVVGMAKIFNGGKRIGYCVDTPNEIREAIANINFPDYPFAKNCFGELVL